MDISTTTQPKSDQQNFDDYGTGGPKTVTIVEVVEGNAEQPVWIHLAEFPGRPYKPNKSMRRVLEYIWGKNTDVYHGRRMTLYGDPTVKFGGSVLGGIKISHLSHLDREKSLSLTETKGKRKPYTVKPLVETAPVAPVTPPSNHLAAVEAAFTAAGIDQGQWLTYAANVLGRTVTAPTDLTEDDAHAVIAALQAELDRRDTAQTGGE